MQYETIHIPFDGRGKNTREAANIIIDCINEGNRKKRTYFIIPGQWSWSLENLCHPTEGLVAILDRMTEGYTFVCRYVNGQMGVIVTPY